MPMIRKQHWVAAVIASFSVLSAPNSFGQVTIEERQRAELPSALISSHRSKMVLTSSNQLDGETTASVMSGQSYSGHYYISSNSDHTVSIDLKDNQDDEDIQLSKFTLVYKGRMYTSFPATGLPSPGEGENVYIGFTVTLRPGVTAGERYPSYEIDVTEEY